MHIWRNNLNLNITITIIKIIGIKNGRANLYTTSYNCKSEINRTSHPSFEDVILYLITTF